MPKNYFKGEQRDFDQQTNNCRMHRFFCACFGLLPHAIADETGYKVYRQSEDKQLGYLIEPIPGNKFSTYLGRHPDLNNSEGIPTWCVNVTQADPKAEDVLSVATLTKPTVTAPAGLQVTTAQMAYLMEKYQHSTDPNVLAGVSYLAHLNFEDEPAPGAVRALYPNTTAQENIQHLRAAVLKYASFIEAQARIYVAEAIAAAPVGYQKGTIAGAGKRHGLIHSLGVTNHAGMYLPGKSITVTLTGPAIFPETGTNTWNGTTAAEPISLAWKATGNGTVSVSSRIASGRTTLTLLETNGKSQNTITLGNRPKIDLTEITTPGPTWKVIYDFQPIGTSQVQKSLMTALSRTRSRLLQTRIMRMEIGFRSIVNLQKIMASSQDMCLCNTALPHISLGLFLPRNLPKYRLTQRKSAA
ncbi:hypothetical protein [Arcanobacterium hippocoleae]|uniref:hypothetical protein n=1 Tax=Arcanobacterium hippocoleae TaxID=149017 RepID=UPI00333F5C94